MRRIKFKRYIFIQTLFILLLTGIGAPSLFAANSVPIGVDVSIDMNMITHSWSQEEKESALNNSRLSLAAHLKEAFPYWEFTPGCDGKVISLHLKVTDPYPDDNMLEAALHVELFYGEKLDKEWIEKWLEPVDIQFRRYPSAETMASQLVGLFKNKFTENRNVNLKQWFQEKVPVAIKARWLERPEESGFNIVLSMDYNAFKTLSSSIFRINGKYQEMLSLSEKLEAQGLSVSLPFPPSSPDPDFYGIVVKAVKRRVADEEKDMESGIKKMTLGPVYLIREITPEPDFDIVISGDDM